LRGVNLKRRGAIAKTAGKGKLREATRQAVQKGEGNFHSMVFFFDFKRDCRTVLGLGPSWGETSEEGKMEKRRA